MILLSGIKSGMESQPQLISTNKHCTRTKLSQMLQNLQVIVGFDSIPNDRAQPLQGLLVGLEVPGDLGLTVEIERPPLGGLHDVLDLEALAVKKPIRGFGETVLKWCGLGWRFGGVLGEDGSEG